MKIITANSENLFKKNENFDQRLPLAACSLSIASNKALKLPFPKLFAPFL
jgi:hypothetical protein